MLLGLSGFLLDATSFLGLRWEWWTALAGFTAGGGTLVLAYYTFLAVKENRKLIAANTSQAEALKQQTIHSTYANLTNMGVAINDLHLEHPDVLRSLFQYYDEVPNDENQPLDLLHEQLDNPAQFSAAMRWLDYLEMIASTLQYMDCDLRDAWYTYMYDVLRRSSYLRQVITYSHWTGTILTNLSDMARSDIIEGRARPEKGLSAPISSQETGNDRRSSGVLISVLRTLRLIQ